MSEINCDNCTKKCEDRVAGSLCTKNKETMDLIRIYESRDPIIISRNLVKILGVEEGRYFKAVTQERIGEIDKKTIVTKKGDVIEIDEERMPNPVVTDMAKSLLKGGKMVHDIVNPPKLTPLFQQNNQYNFGSGVADEIALLPAEEREAKIKFIDEKLNA